MNFLILRIVKEMNNNSSNSDDQIMSELNKQYDQADEQKENRNKSDQSEHKGNRITKLVIGILMIIVSVFLPVIAFFVGVANTFTDTGDVGGTAGYLLSLFWLASGIVLIATHNHLTKKGGEIAVLVMMIISWLLAIGNCAVWQDLIIYGWLSFIIGFGFFIWKLLILGISKKGKIIFSIATVLSLLAGIGINVVTMQQAHKVEQKMKSSVFKTSKSLKKANKDMKKADDAINGNDKATKKRLAKDKWNNKILTLTTDKYKMHETFANLQPDINKDKYPQGDLVIYYDLTNISNKEQTAMDLFDGSDSDTVEALQTIHGKTVTLDTADTISGKDSDKVDQLSDHEDKKLQPNQIGKGVMLWHVKSNTLPVTLKFKAEKGLGYTTIGKQTIPLQR